MSRQERAKAKVPADVASARNSGTRPRVHRLGKLVTERERLLSSEAPVSSNAHDSGVQKVVDRSAEEDDTSSCLVTEYVAGQRVPRAEVQRTRRPEGKDIEGLEATLDRALSSLWMAYQPIVQAATGSLFGYEALLRSEDPALPDPNAFLDAAERLGRVYDVGRAVRRKASEPMNRVPLPALLFVNLHAVELTDETLTSPSAPLTAIAPRVVLEITERASLESIEDVPSRVARLRELGFRIAIDDLGAGYSGLTSVARLEPEFVKLDMSLVRDIHKSPVKRKLVRSMTALFKDMGVTVVAEGIEVVEERDTLVELGCDLLQGYLLARPGRAFPEVRK
jgi:EAL domain-containing protein (putative c-di-GMP-specific phosphodiesterase class I)